MATKAVINSERVLGHSDPKIYGHFLEHFHDQIYGGVYDAASPFADEHGLRKDVMEAVSNLAPRVIRWPGGCFVSAYHWEDGVGKVRTPHFDKAWRVEESNIFGTDEFIQLCRTVGAEPYICTNAGTGTPEEMSNWVEYCNLKSEGKWARKRIDNGNVQPFGVKYWSIGNENYLPGEMGSKTAAEWGVFVRESAKMMKRVDPTIEVLAASVADIDWNVNLLREAGPYLDWLSIHGYWDHLWQNNNLSSYEVCMSHIVQVEKEILKTKHMLGAFGYLGKIRIAFDEWNLRGWHHPNVDSATEDYLTPRELNNINSSYTMADAVFSACFLNQCLRHSDVVGMANFAPTVNTRGAIYAHKDGIVLRSTYFVFELFSNRMGDVVIDSWVPEAIKFELESANGQTGERLDSVDMVATKHSNQEGLLSISLVNRDPNHIAVVQLQLLGGLDFKNATLYGVTADSKDAYNDIGRDEIRRSVDEITVKNEEALTIELRPHSVYVLELR